VPSEKGKVEKDLRRKKKEEIKNINLTGTEGELCTKAYWKFRKNGQQSLSTTFLGAELEKS